MKSRAKTENSVSCLPTPLPGQITHDAFMLAFRGYAVLGVSFAELTPDVRRCWEAAEEAARTRP